jgi:glycine/D-amino acid oxidase-like deaminating enzyme
VQIPITLERAQMAFLRRAPSIRHLIYIDTISGSYFRPHGADLTLAGLGGRKVDDADPDHFREANDRDFIDAVRRRLGARIPALVTAPRPCWHLRCHA